jgi:hypothetical protein
MLENNTPPNSLPPALPFSVIVPAVVVPTRALNVIGDTVPEVMTWVTVGIGFSL